MIDCGKGVVYTEYSGTKEITYAFHEQGYIALEPNDQLNYVAFVEQTAGSTAVYIKTNVPEDLTGYYLWIDGAWNKVVSMDEDGDAVLTNAAQTTGAGDVHVARMNEISIRGSNVSLTALSYTYEPRTI